MRSFQEISGIDTKDAMSSLGKQKTYNCNVGHQKRMLKKIAR